MIRSHTVHIITLLLVSCQITPYHPPPSDTQEVRGDSAPVKVDPTIGIGLLDIDLNHYRLLYRDMSYDEPFDYLQFDIARKGKDKGKFRMSTTYGLSLKPFRYFEGDSETEAYRHEASGLIYRIPRLTFKVVEAREGMYRIVLNEDTFETAVIKKDPYYKLYNGGNYEPTPFHREYLHTHCFTYQPWEEFLKRVIEVGPLQDHDPLYDSPNGHQIANDPPLWGQVIRVEGNWIQLEGFPSGSRSRKKPPGCAGQMERVC